MTKPAEQQTTTTEQRKAPVEPAEFLSLREMPEWLDFAREMLGMCASRSLVERLTDTEMLKLSGYLEKLAQVAREQGWNDGWHRGYSDGIDYCTDYLRLIEEPPGPQRGA